MADATTRGNAYELLSRPTLTLTDAEVSDIVADLRQRRLAYVSGKKDVAPKKAATAEDKAVAASSIAAELGLDLDL